MKRVILTFLTGLFLLSTAYTKEESIVTLLKKYEGESELSKKTKEESLGHIIVFTRKDLEIMQAHTLADVLRLIPLFNFLPNQHGVETLLNPPGPLIVHFAFRLYIDGHEVSSIHTSNPFLIYDRYPLDNINHIEIYYSAGAISVSSEPSQMIIKMYTKLPSRENSSKLRVTVGSKKSYTVSFLSAKRINDYSCFLVNFSKSYFTFPKPVINSHNINRNQFRKNLFIKYKYFDSQIELSAVDVKRGGFMGLSADKSPEYASTKSFDTYLSFSQNFDKDAKLEISYDYQKRKYKELNSKSDGGIFIPDLYDPLNPPTYYYEDLNLHKFTVSLDKKIKSKKNSLLLGSFLRYYIQDPEENEYGDSLGSYDLKSRVFRVKSFYIGSFYGENSFNINDKNLLIAGIKYDKYKFYGQKSKGRISGRIGVISFINHSIMLKSFISHYYVLPSMMLIEFSKNKKLDPIKSTVFTGEAKYLFGKNEIRFFYAYYRLEDMIRIDKNTQQYININGSKNFHKYGIFYKRKLNGFTNFEFNYWIVDIGKNSLSPERGGYIRIAKEFESFNIYSDLVYKGSYRPLGINVKESYNLRLSIGYKLPDDWFIKLTGENLLNSSEKGVYWNFLGEKGYFSVYDRRILLTVEKVF